MTRRRRFAAVALGALLTALAACSAEPGIDQTPTPTLRSTPTPRPLPTASPTPSPTTPPPPEVVIGHETCCSQAARFLDAGWEADVPVAEASLTLAPQPEGACSVSVAADGLGGRFGCEGLLAGATEYVAALVLSTAHGTYETVHRFRTMGDRLADVPWFTEFEDATGPPLACAAASVRSIQLFTAGEDPMTAEQIVALGTPFNRSNDPGIDPVAIASALDQLHPDNDYHYYAYATPEEATEAAVYWLLRSGKPVIAVTLAGQHAPLVVGFTGTYGSGPDDPANRITGIIVMDPQRGDLRPETNRRPDIYRAATFQTGHLIELDEWYGHEWWFRYPYWYASRAGVPMDRNDGAYPTPHWTGHYVILVDDGDAEQPSDLMGRVAIPR